MKTLAWITGIVLGAGLCGCGRSPSLDTRTFELQHLEASRAGDLVRPYVFEDRAGAPGRLSVTDGALTVRETVDNLNKIARVLEQYDRAEPGVRLRFQVILADGAAAADPAIEEVEAELRKLFRFRGYRLVGEAWVAGIEGSEISQSVAGGGGSYRITGEIREIRASGDSGAVKITVRLLLSDGERALESTVSLPAGRTVVLGNAQADKTRGGTLILTVRPELVR